MTSARGPLGLLSDEDYDASLLDRMEAETGRRTMPSWEEQRGALAQAARQGAGAIGDAAYEFLIPQTPLDLALAVAFSPGGRAGIRLLRSAGSHALHQMFGMGEPPPLISTHPFEQQAPERKPGQ